MSSADFPGGLPRGDTSGRRLGLQTEEPDESCDLRASVRTRGTEAAALRCELHEALPAADIRIRFIAGDALFHAAWTGSFT